MSGVNPMVALALNGDIIEEIEETNNVTGETNRYYTSAFYTQNPDKTLTLWPIRGNRLNVSEHGSRYYTDFNFAMSPVSYTHLDVYKRQIWC